MGKKKTPSRTVGDTPTPPITKRSLNPAIIDDNIAKLEKAIKAGDVTPNPSGTSEETLLTTIGIDGKKYDIGANSENVSYDNTDSGLTADNVQSAIDEINAKAVIDSGSNENGNYIKFSDGTMICTKTYDFSGAINTASGSLFESDNLSLGVFAVEFLSAPIVTLNSNIYGMLTGARSVTKANAGLCNIIRTTSLSSTTGVIDVFAIGKWK